MVRTLALVVWCSLVCCFSTGIKSCNKIGNSSEEGKEATATVAGKDDAAPLAKQESAPPSKVVNEQAFGSCDETVKCAATKADCCGCSAGGKQIAIPESKVEAFNAEISKTCGDQVCAQMVSKDPSCSKKPTCNHGKCGLE